MDDAVNDATRLSSGGGENFNALRLLGVLMIQNNLPVRAAIIFDALSEIVNNDQQILLSHAYTLILSGNSTGALSILDNVFPDPEDPALAWLLRGKALIKAGRSLEASRAFRMFIRYRQAGNGRT